LKVLQAIVGFVLLMVLLRAVADRVTQARTDGSNMQDTSPSTTAIRALCRPNGICGFISQQPIRQQT
jgi:hypothetical protein